MTTKTLTGTYASGYVLNPPVTLLSIATSGYVEGSGIATGTSTVSVSVVNDGRVKGSHFGIYLTAYGAITNGSATDTTARIYGAIVAVYENSGGPGKVSNFASIEANTSVNGLAVDLYDGGLMTNGSATDKSALVQGVSGVRLGGAAGTFVNFGAVMADAGGGGGVAPYGVVLNAGQVTNGSAADTTARIQGDYGVDINGANGGAGTVTNYGTIEGSPGGGGYGVGVQMETTGQITNGSAKDTVALISGAYGVAVGPPPTGAPATVTNFGDIEGTYLNDTFLGVDKDFAGVFLAEGGVVINGSSADLTAKVRGDFGVLVKNSSGTVSNFGRIVGAGTGAGVELDAGGVVTNGSASDTKALIAGHAGGVVMGASGTVDNFGSILGDFSSYAYAAVIDGGSLANGSTADKAALIEGYKGVQLTGAATNFGTIEATNGIAVNVFESSTLTNFGTILSGGGAAVSLGPDCSLVVEPGCVFGGSVTGGGSDLKLDGGTGTITLSAAANVAVVSGSMARTTFASFGTVDIDAKSAEALSGTGSVRGLDFLDIEGALSAAGNLDLLANTFFPGAAGGQLTLTGTLSGAGTLNVGAGALAAFGTGASLGIGHVTLSTTTSQAQVNDASLAYAGQWIQNGGTLTVASGDTVIFTGVGDTFKGTLAGAGRVVLGGDSDTLSSLAIDNYLTISGAGTVTATGALILGEETSLNGGTLVIGVGTGGATLSGGTLALGSSSVVIGATARGTLTNINTAILGAGQLGDGRMRLVNDTAGSIGANSATAALVINTGAVVIINDGQLDSYAAGGMVIESFLSNAGLLEALGGNITCQKAVSGAGSVEINSATADFASTFTQNVDFVGAFYLPPVSGTLELAKSQSYTGTISGFTTTGTTALDLADIVFVKGTTKATYSGTTTSGVLTVTDGTHTAKINFAGNYTTSGWTLSSDGHGGTSIVDPAQPTAPATAAAPNLPSLITAMAGFGGGAGSALTPSRDFGRLQSTLLVRPA